MPFQVLDEELRVFFVAHLQVNVKRWTGGGRLPSSQRLVFGILPAPTKV